MTRSAKLVVLSKKVPEERPHHGLKLLVSPQDIPLPMTESCGNASWAITDSALRELVKLPTAKEQHAACLNVINVLMKLMAFQVTASASDSILAGPPLVIATRDAPEPV